MQAEFSVEQQDQTYSAQLSLSVPSDQRIEYLCFSLAMPAKPETLSGGVLVERQGDWHRIRVEDPDMTEIVIAFEGVGQLPKGTDYPYGIYAETAGGRVAVHLKRPTHYRMQTLAEQPSELSFIPSVRHTISPDTAECPEQFVFNGASWNVGWLQRLLTRLSVNPSMVVSLGDAEAWQATAELDSSLDEAFALTVNARGAHLSYRSVAGFHQGQAVLFQYLMQWICIRTLPACEVRDTPEYDYRGIHLDVARHFFSADDIMAWWDVLALFQYNVFHWHLTDDDGWRIDSQTYPELTQIGAWRGPEEVLPPQMGSGHLRYGGSYSPDQVTELVERLAGLGVMVVPEMDLPGHSRALLKSLPDLVEDDDHSLYRSVQHYHDNVINPAYGPTMDYLETLIKEWCALFPGELFHLGCDEVPAGAWSESPSARQASEQGHGTPLTQLVENVKQLLAAEGKTLAGWEEIAEGQPAPETWVYSWQGVKAGQAAAEKGHPVVMTPAQHCYLDLAVTDAIDDPGYWWAGTVDMRQVYEYQPTAGLSAEATQKIQGVQYCLWTELVDSADKVEFMWFPRLLAGAEVVWGSNTNETYEAFENRAEQWTQWLLRLGVKVRSKKMSWEKPS